ncbi:alpha/beta hydrolase [Pseudomonas sp. JDS28PS106]|uniref:alpha/beta hydrolase n=1 Tax=Pseudomonas sp. JDS28PS106 TaxID=2497235 RepID=UPI002FD32557
MSENASLNPLIDQSRRKILIGGSALTAGLLLPKVVFAAASATTQVGKIQCQSIQFMKNDIPMAGNLYLPEHFNKGKKYAAIICVHPGGGVKEQTAGLYAQKLAEQGFVTMAFDASHQGASGGLPRFLDDPMNRVDDIYHAVDYMVSLPFVDADRIGALGVCAGSGTAVKAVCTERRIKALGTVSAVDVGAATRLGWDGKTPVADQLSLLENVAKQRTAESKGAAPIYVPYVPQVGDKTAPHDLQQAADYYLTPRGQHPNAPNKLLFTSLTAMVSFTGFDRADTLLTQPLMIVAGSEAGSLWHSKALYSMAPGEKKLTILPGMTHMDLYDGHGSDLAMNELAPFFNRHL